MTTSMGASMPAGMENFAYLVGDLSAVAGAAAVGRARKKAAEPGSAAAPAAAAAPKERDKPQGRRRAKVQMLGRGHEYMNLEDEDVATVTASATGAGPQGFAGTATNSGAGRAAGLTTLADDAFGGGPRLPMIPRTWGADSPPLPESEAGD